MQKILKNASGFVYLITMLGITGTKTAKIEDNLEIFSTLKTQTNLPIVAGFGIKNSTQILEFKKLGFDGIVIGSEIIKEIDLTKTSQQISQNIEKKVAEFAKAIKS
jgi:tryptophan synthase alpha chain